MEASNNSINIKIVRNESIERSVIGTLLMYNELYTQNKDILSNELFHDIYFNTFDAIKAIIDNHGIATPVTVVGFLNEKGFHFERIDIQSMVALCDKDAFLHNVNKLDDYRRRNLARTFFLQYANQAVNLGEKFDEIMESFKNDISAVNNVNVDDGITTSSDAMQRIKKHVDDVRNDNMPQGIMTGFQIFDRNYGLHEDQLIIIAARTGVGKSSAAMNIAANVARNGNGVAYYSLEMGVEELWARVMSYDMKMRALDIMHKKLSDQEINRLCNVAENYSKYPLYIDEEATVTFERLTRSIRKVVLKYNVKLVVVDYLQILRQEKTSENEALSLANMTRELKNIAKELHIPIILLSQLNRGGAKDGVLSKFGLRGSGEIEEAADTVVMIDRPDADPNTKGGNFSGQFSNVSTFNKAVFRLDKGRSTGGAEYLMDFNPEYTMFTDAGVNTPDTTYSGPSQNTVSGVFEANTDDVPF